jgi:hypothetical protein
MEATMCSYCEEAAKIEGPEMDKDYPNLQVEHVKLVKDNPEFAAILIKAIRNAYNAGYSDGLLEAAKIMVESLV